MEKFLHKCLSSLVVDGTSASSLEVLVVIDGSKDKSAEIGRSFQKKYPDIFRVIEKENGNYGSCINRGLKEATGKFVKVLDADDYFNKTVVGPYLEFLANVDADMILTDFSYVNEKYEKTGFVEYDIVANTMVRRDELCVNDSFKKIEMHAVTYKKSVLTDMDYKQTEGISYTDTEWTFKPLSNVQTIYYHKIDLYQYLFGREGQTVNPAVQAKSMNQKQKVVISNLEFYKAIRTDISAPLKEFYDFKLLLWAGFIYRMSIIKKLYETKLLAEFDCLVKNTDDYFFNLLATLTLRGGINFKYVSYFREHNDYAPWYIRCVYSVGRKLALIKNKGVI